MIPFPSMFLLFSFWLFVAFRFITCPPPHHWRCLPGVSIVDACTGVTQLSISRTASAAGIRTFAIILLRTSTFFDRLPVPEGLEGMMLHLLRNGRVYLWSPAVPVVAGLISDGVLHWQGADQPSAVAAPVGWQQPHTSSSVLLPEAAALVDAAESQLLMGRGDPRTRRGKVINVNTVS